EGYNEDLFPLSEQIFKVMTEDFAYVFNWITFHIYFDWDSKIGPHKDGYQTTGRKENKDTIVTLSLFGSKLLKVTLDKCGEKCIFLHECNDIYIMHGMQDFTEHSK